MEDVVGKETLEIMSQADYYNQWTFEIIKPYLKGNIAEVGAGIGAFVEKIRIYYPDVTAIDFNENYLEHIQKTQKGIKTQQLDLQSAAISTSFTEKFDTIVAINVLEHLPNLDLALSHLYKMLKPNGRLIVLVPSFQFAFGDMDRNLGHVQRFTESKFANFLKPFNFKFITARYINLLGLIGWWINGKILKKQAIPKNQVKLFNLLGRPWLALEKYIQFPLGLSLIYIVEKT